ncbi:hypothetical protein L6164_025580 [Bauhinia variegata]|uniref:Uncharacterized protein n=1 Tax=Bauhinia variegata TaxID=167791 RepID=A0ACB9M1B0_BAUVA|nr:hypothetical protein L6164_025580 [Bauhinia variegata]
MSGPQCCSNPPTLNPSSGAGHVEKLGGLKAYVSGPSDSKLAILLVSDVFGFEAPNLRMVADKVAAAGYYVVVPDFLNGDPYVPDDANRPLRVWIKDHAPDKGCEDAKTIIAALKSKGLTAIGAAGFCWGGMVVVKLAGCNDIQAAVLLHPGPISNHDINAVKVPIAILGAEVDNYFPPEELKKCGELLSSKPELESFVKMYPGVAHGWTVRYNAEEESAVKRAEEAHEDMLNWFAKHVK